VEYEIYHWAYIGFEIIEKGAVDTFVLVEIHKGRL
jgi:hypothetical protein